MFKNRLKELLLAAAILPVMLAQPAFAHVVWFEQGNGDYDLVFGHPEEGPEPYDVAKFQSAQGYDINKQLVPLEVKIQDGVSVIPQGDIAALTAFYDNGFWLTNPADSTSTNISKQEAEALNYVNVSNFLKYTKALYNWSQPLWQSFGLPLEIMALENPFEVIEGESLPIQVSFQGNVIKDALVEYLGEVVDVNQEGIAYIPVGKGGLQVIEASYTNPTATNPGLSYATTFSADSKNASVPEPSALLGLSVLGLMAFARKQGKGLKFTK